MERDPNSAEVYHALVTRFNVPLGLSWHLNPDWLALRLRLLKQFLLPSLAAQTSQQFDWLVLVHEKTPSEILSMFQDLRRPFTVPTFVVGTPNDPLRRTATCRAIAETVRSRCEEREPGWILTSRCDSDDAVSKYFVNDVQKQFLKRKEQAFYSFPLGYVWKEGAIAHRRKRYEKNQFMTFAEPYREGTPIKTVYCEEHDKVHRVAPLRLIETATSRSL